MEPFGLMYPGMSADKKKTTGKADDPFEGTEWAGADTVETSITIPCFVLGSTGEPNFKISPIINEAKYASIRDQRIVPVMGGNRMAFGRFPVGTAEAELVNEAVSKWKLSSWRRMTAALSGAAPKSSVRSTIVVDAPQRRVTIRRYTLVPDTLIVTGLEDRRYKDYKIQGVS